VIRPGCPDGGTCHHECEAACWRVSTCGPLSGVFPGDRWPEEVRGGVVIRPGMIDTQLVTSGDCPETNDRDAPGSPWFCTRDAGHDGPHVATGGRRFALAVWTKRTDLATLTYDTPGQSGQRE